MAKDTVEKNIRLDIAYDGTGFFGWQRQVDKPTVQGIIEEKIGLMVGGPVSLIASGRTDAGVHALNQAANFRVCSSINPEAFQKGLNSLLPDSIVIHRAEYVPLDFHSRYSARSKVYEYRIYTAEPPSPFLRHYAWHIPRPLDANVVKECLDILRGTHDFFPFCSAVEPGTNTVRRIIHTSVEHREGNILAACIEADGFLRHMVRNIMGTVIRAGQGDLSTGEFREIMESGDRQKVKLKAPPGGLYLREVRY